MCRYMLPISFLRLGFTASLWKSPVKNPECEAPLIIDPGACLPDPLAHACPTGKDSDITATFFRASNGMSVRAVFLR